MEFALMESVVTRSQRRLEEVDFELLCEAERAGYDALWLSAPEDDAAEASAWLPLLAAQLAVRTTRARVGLALGMDPALHPLRLAEDLATLDVVAGGRLDWAIGIERRTEGELAERSLVERFGVVCRAWSGECFAHEGREFRFPEVRCLPIPERRPHPRLWAPNAAWRVLRAALPEHASDESPYGPLGLVCDHTAEAEASVLLAARCECARVVPRALVCSLFLSAEEGASAREGAEAERWCASARHASELVIAGDPIACRERLAALRERFDPQLLILRPAAQQRERRALAARLFIERVASAG